MLLQLPKELVINISNYLDFKDKLNLALTCQRINQVVVEYSLYEKLSIQPDFNITRDIVKKFKNKEFNGAQVKQLQLCLNHLSNQQYRKLPIIFPNVAELINTKESSGSYYYASLKWDEKKRDDYVIEPLVKWHNKLERYDMKKGFLRLFHLINENTFSKLTHLVMNSICVAEASIELINCFKNAPFLKSLGIYNAIIDIKLLEDLHTFCLQLVSFHLWDSLILLNDDTRLESNIVPATALSSLILENSTTIYDRNCVFLDYIIAKYKSLCHFEFFSGFRPLTQQIDSLELGVLYHRFRTSNYDYKITETVYKVEGARILLTLPKTLKTLKMNPILFDNIIEALDNSQTKPETLEFYRKESPTSGKQLPGLFTRSNQLQYLQKTISLSILTAGFHHSLQIYKEIISVSITKLTISVYSSSGNKSLKLDWLLSCFPSLKELNVTVSKLCIVGDKTNLAQHPHLYRLGILGIVDTNRGLLNYVHTVAPNITDLAWVMCSDATFDDPCLQAGKSIISHQHLLWFHQKTAQKPNHHLSPPIQIPSGSTSLSLQQLRQQQLQKQQQPTQKKTLDNVIYIMNLPGRKMEILRLQTNFEYQGHFLLVVQTTDQIVCCSFTTGQKGKATFNSMIDRVAFRQSLLPKVIVKCDSIKKLVFDKTNIPLNN